MASRSHPSARHGRAGRGLQERNARVQAHLALVGPIASHYARRSPESCDDLDQVGRLGLIRAAELYDSQQAVPFSAYARRHVRGAILHYLRDTAPLVREPRRLQERRRLLRQQECRLTSALGRRPSSEELRRSLALNEEQWSDLARTAGGWQQGWLDELEQNQHGDDEEQAEQDCRRGERLRSALHALPAPQRRVLRSVVLEGLSLRKVAEQQGTSLTTTHRQLQRALDLLRTRLSDPSAVPGC